MPLLFIVVVFSPFARASWDIWAETFIHVVSLVILLVYLIQKLWDSESLSFRNNVKSAYFPLAVFLIISAVSYLTSINRFNTRNELFNLINYAFLFFLAGGLMGNRTTPGDRGFNSRDEMSWDENRQYFFWLLMGIGAVLSLIGFRQFLDRVSVTGTMVNPNILAGYLVMLLPVSLGLVIKNRALKNRRILFLVTSGLILICLFLTRSLGGIIGAFLGVLLVAHLMLGREFLRRYRYHIITLFVLMGVLLMVKLGEVNITNRLSWWKAGIKMIVDHPFSGVGFGNFGSAYPCYKSGALNSLYAHNVLLRTGAETGVPGLMVFIWFLIRILRRRKASDNILFCSICGVLVQNLVDYNLCIPANAILFWMLLGMMNGKREDNLKGGISLELNREKKGILTVIIIIMVLGASAAAIKPFLASRYWVFGNNRVREAGISPGETEKKEGKPGINALKEAELFYRKAIGLDPLNSMNYSALADVYMSYYVEDNRRSWLDEAVIELDEAVKYQPLHAPFYRNLSLLYQLKMDYAGAVEKIRKAIEYDRNNREYRKILNGLVKISSMTEKIR